MDIVKQLTKKDFAELTILQILPQLLSVITLTFAIICLAGHGEISGALFENKVAIWLGKISYSLYLVHMFVIAFIPDTLDKTSFIRFTLVLSLTAFASTLTYLFIEKPGVKLGRKLLTSAKAQA